MEGILYKRFILTHNLFLPFSILDLKTQMGYVSIFLNNKYQTIYLPNKITHFPSFLFIYLFSKGKKFAATSLKQITNKIKYFYVNYKLFIELVGTGYKFFFKKRFLYLSLGYSHLVKIKLPAACLINVENNHKSLALTYANKYVLGNIFYIIKCCRQIDRYKGKGIKNMLVRVKLKLNKTKFTKK